jgi:hypothetical protein
MEVQLPLLAVDPAMSATTDFDSRVLTFISNVSTPPNFHLRSEVPGVGFSGL